MARASLVLLAIGLAVSPAASAGQEPPTSSTAPDPGLIEASIGKAVEFLKRGESPPWGDANSCPNSDELILWALFHAGVPEGDPYIQKLLKAVLEGLQWLSKDFSVTCNPGTPEPEHKLAANSLMYHYYHLYALERACMLYGAEVLGASKWYPEGVAALLPKQLPDGSWVSPVREGGLNAISDTCFAILFLRRATLTAEA